VKFESFDKYGVEKGSGLKKRKGCDESGNEGNETVLRQHDNDRDNDDDEDDEDYVYQNEEEDDDDDEI
jgi:hypothetical protein